MAEKDKPAESEKQQESLELDKLNVSAKATKAEELSVSVSEKPHAKPAAARGRLAPLWQGLLALVKDKAFFISAFVVLLVGAVFLFFISSKPSPPQQGASIADATGRIIYLVSSPIGLGNYVEIKLSVPFKDADEKRDLMKRLAKVKHELPSASTLPEVTESIRKRDLDALREHIINIVCEVTGVPTEKLDLEIQSLE